MRDHGLTVSKHRDDRVPSRSRRGLGEPPRPADRYLGLQRHLGNRAVNRFLQRKASISHPQEPAELEADRIADGVVASESAVDLPGTPRLSRVAAPRVQREPVEFPPTGFDTRYPGCTGPQSRALAYEIPLGRTNVLNALGQLSAELDSIQSPQRGAGTITLAGSALARYFKTRDPRHVKTILGRLERIAKMLDRGPDNWVCVPHCASVCGNPRAAACTSPVSPVHVCDLYFTYSTNHSERSMTLVHEAAHQVGLGGDTYQYLKQFPDLTTAQALVNADSYAYFVQELALGGLPPPKASAAEAPPPSAWSAELLAIMLNLRAPAPVKQALVTRSTESHLTRAESRIKARATGDLWFHVDANNPSLVWPLGTLFRLPRIGATITLLRRSVTPALAKPAREVLFTQEVSEGIYRGPGEFLRPPFTFDLTFDAADRGELIVDAWLIDLETSTRLRLQESLDVAP